MDNTKNLLVCGLHYQAFINSCLLLWTICIQFHFNYLISLVDNKLTSLLIKIQTTSRKSRSIFQSGEGDASLDEIYPNLVNMDFLKIAIRTLKFCFGILANIFAISHLLVITLHDIIKHLRCKNGWCAFNMLIISSWKII